MRYIHTNEEPSGDRVKPGTAWVSRPPPAGGGGTISSDGGGMLLSQVEAKAGIIERPADLFGDHRDPELIGHTPRKLAQRPADRHARDHR